MFKVSIKTGNAAFGDEPEHEICRILRDIAKQMESNGYLQGSCYVINGNTVGHYDFLNE